VTKKTRLGNSKKHAWHMGLGKKVATRSIKKDIQANNRTTDPNIVDEGGVSNRIVRGYGR